MSTVSFGALLAAMLPVAQAGSGTGVAWSTTVRMPLADTADPLPWRGTGVPPMGAMRLDLLPGLAIHTASAWEVDVNTRFSGYAMAWADETIAPGSRGGVELGVRRFVPPNDYREDMGPWTGGYAGGTVMAEVWGRHPVGTPKVGTVHVVVGYKGLVGDVQPAFLELGVGAWADAPAEAGGGGFVARVGADFNRPFRGFGAR